MSDAPAREAFALIHTLRVRYSEIDAQAVVYNAHYLVYYDIGITEYLRRCGFDQMQHAEDTGRDFHLVKSTVEYRQPIRYDELIDVAVRVARIGRSSVTFELAIFANGADTRYSSGEIVWVYTDLGAGRSAAMAPALAAQLRALPQ